MKERKKEMQNMQTGRPVDGCRDLFALQFAESTGGISYSWGTNVRQRLSGSSTSVHVPAETKVLADLH